MVARDKQRGARRSSSGDGQDRLFLFSPKGDIDALSSEQMVQVLVSREISFDQTTLPSKQELKEMVRLTTSIASPVKAVGKSKRKLLILDINGFLVDRAAFILRGQPAQEHLQTDQKLMKRPFLEEFMNLIFNELNFDVTVWTASRCPLNSKKDKFLDVSQQEMAMFGEGGYKLATDPQYQEECDTVDLRSATTEPAKPLFLKRLANFWATHPQYDEHNTVIIENDVEKVDCNRPENVICPAEWNRNVKDDRFLHPKGEFCEMLRQLATCTDVLTFPHTHQNLPAVVKLFAVYQEREMPNTVRSSLIVGRTEYGKSSKLRMNSSMDRIVKTREDWINLTGTLFFTQRFDLFPFLSYSFIPFLLTFATEVLLQHLLYLDTIYTSRFFF